MFMKRRRKQPGKKIELKKMCIGYIANKKTNMAIRFGREKNSLTISPPLCYFNDLPTHRDHAEVAQLVEQRPEKPRVRSSILRLGTILNIPAPSSRSFLSNHISCSLRRRFIPSQTTPFGQFFHQETGQDILHQSMQHRSLLVPEQFFGDHQD